MAIGDVFNAEIIGLQKYGAFVKFDGDKKGLVHISELRSGFVKDIHEEVKMGNKLKVQVIDIDEYSGRVSLSARTLEEHPQTHRATRKHFFTDHRIEIGFAPLDELMPRWTKEQEAYLKNHHA
ncbi:MAG: S1 RNA-binding domain-containing protein [Streptococcaceae bacterium]|nr:S1 RNA-binding domain-containing protein [Streptococcaceae bacterium]